MLYDRVFCATATTGTGTVTLGDAETGFRTFADAAIPDGTVVEYAITDGTAFETGTGVVAGAATTMTRVVSQSSAGNAPLDLSGAATVLITPIAAQMNQFVKTAKAAALAIALG